MVVVGASDAEGEKMEDAKMGESCQWSTIKYPETGVMWALQEIQGWVR